MVDEINLDKEIPVPEEEKTEEKKKHPALKFLLYFALILVLTGFALFLSLYQDFNGVINALSNARVDYIVLIVGLVFLSYLLDGLMIFIFVRLYTRNYHYPSGLAVSLVGIFYSMVTPGSSGGQAMQVYTLKKQGVEVSNAASIMIMSFIIYQMALITMGIVGLIFKWDLIMTIGEFTIPLGELVIKIPAIPFTILGFALNLFIILMLFVMSFSHGIHNFVMNHGINFLAKLKILKHPDKTREDLRIQVENFKIELKRLGSNIPVTILIFIIFSLMLVIRFSIPYFAGLALNGFEGYLVDTHGALIIVNGAPVLPTGSVSVKSFWDAVFLSSYHQMVSGLIPVPGSAGVSEYFFSIIFSNFFVSQQITSAAQIVWRFSTYHLILLLSGIFSASYHVSPKETGHHADRKTFVTIQYETYQLRKESADTMYETASLSRKEVREKLKAWNEREAREREERRVKRETERTDRIKAREEKVTESVTKKETKPIFKSKPFIKKKKTKEDDWDEIKLGD